MSQEAELIAQAEIGEEARKFVESDLGKVIIGLAKQEADLALEKLETIDAKETELIRQLQYEIKFGRSFERWLVELIDEGDNAISVFKQQSEG